MPNMLKARHVDIAALRGKLDLTQLEFAQLCGVSVGTLRNWEQRRRHPSGPAKTLLRLVEADPMGAAKILRSIAY